MAPAHSLARLRKHVLDRVARGEVTMVAAAEQLGCSRSRLCELKDRYSRYGEAGLFPKPRPSGAHPARVLPACRDQIVAYAVEHPTEGPRRSPGSWANAQTYRSSEHRRTVLPRWLRYYNHTRLHGSLGHKPPISLLAA